MDNQTKFIDITPTWWATATTNEQMDVLAMLATCALVCTVPEPTEFRISASSLMVSIEPDGAGDKEQTASWSSVAESAGAVVRSRLFIGSASREQLAILCITHGIVDMSTMSETRLRAELAVRLVYGQINQQWGWMRSEMFEWSVHPEWNDCLLAVLREHGHGACHWKPCSSQHQAEES